jgi:PTS system mannose-specific IIB component
MIVLTRVDSRLIHGQVIEAWLPHLKAERLVVADDESSADPLTRMAMSMAVPQEVEVVLEPLQGVDFQRFAADGKRTVMLFRDVDAVLRARALGLGDGALNLGNVHAGPGRVAVSRSVFLTEAERVALTDLVAHGVQVTVQAVPAEKPVALPH